MAVINLTIPDAQMPRVITAITSQYGYQSVLPNGDPNPQTPAQFTKAHIMAMIKNEVLRHEQNVAKAAAENGITAVDIT